MTWFYNAEIQCLHPVEQTLNLIPLQTKHQHKPKNFSSEGQVGDNLIIIYRQGPSSLAIKMF